MLGNTELKAEQPGLRSRQARVVSAMSRASLVQGFYVVREDGVPGVRVWSGMREGSRRGDSGMAREPER